MRFLSALCLLLRYRRLHVYKINVLSGVSRFISKRPYVYLNTLLLTATKF